MKYISIKETSNGYVLDIESGKAEVFEKSTSTVEVLKHDHINRLLTRVTEVLLDRRDGEVFATEQGEKKISIWVTVTERNHVVKAPVAV